MPALDPGSHLRPVKQCRVGYCPLATNSSERVVDLAPNLMAASRPRGSDSLIAEGKVLRPAPIADLRFKLLCPSIFQQPCLRLIHVSI